MSNKSPSRREEGGGLRIGNTCIPVADSFRYLAKLIQLCKVKKKKKVHLVKAMVFPVVMYGCESWTIKKAEC